MRRACGPAQPSRRHCSGVAAGSSISRGSCCPLRAIRASRALPRVTVEVTVEVTATVAVDVTAEVMAKVTAKVTAVASGGGNIGRIWLGDNHLVRCFTNAAPGHVLGDCRKFLSCLSFLFLCAIKQTNGVRLGYRLRTMSNG